MFSVYFVQSLCGGTTEDRANFYDRFFGQLEPGTATVDDEVHTEEDTLALSTTRARQTATHIHPSPLSYAHFKQHVSRILAVDTWPQFFHVIQRVCPNKKQFATHLRDAVRNSRRKGYHTAGMDFGRVQASGVSHILKKGLSCAASGLRRLVFTDTWSWTRDTETKYLDASCLLFAGHALKYTVDYSITRGPGVVHSGDVLSGNSGSHTIHIDLQMVPSNVTTLVFVLSAFNAAKLAEFQSPAVRFADEATGVDLCSYNLEAHNKTASLTAIVMCKLYRVQSGGWHVLAIGESCRGTVSQYAPVLEAVQPHLV